MTGKTHSLIGANTVWLMPFFGVSPHLWSVLIGSFAGLLPDLDASESKIKHFDIPVHLAGVRMHMRPFYLPAVLAHTLFRHRGWLHSLIAVIVVGIGSTLLFGRHGIEYPLMITIGYLSHIVTDMLTVGGVRFLLPFPVKIRLLPKQLHIHTGGMLDGLLAIAAAAGLLYFFLAYPLTT